jgi:hypothetical protein
MQVDLFKQQLRQGGLIDMVNVRSIALDGCPDTGNLRLIAWKVRPGGRVLTFHPSQHLNYHHPDFITYMV